MGVVTEFAQKEVRELGGAGQIAGGKMGMQDHHHVLETMQIAGGKMGVDHHVLETMQIDPEFVVQQEHRPTLKYDDYNTAVAQQQQQQQHVVPVIDLSPLTRSKQKKSSPPSGLQSSSSSASSAPHQEHAHSIHTLVEQVGKACAEWGFFQVINHGVSLALLEELETNARSFFALPLQEKTKVHRTFENSLGYYDRERTKNVRDWKEVFDFATSGMLKLPADLGSDGRQVISHTNQWPENPSTLREVCEKWSKVVEGLAFELLGLISQSLGLPATYFHKYWLPDDTNFVRMNYYPKCPMPNLTLGVTRHKDAGCLTVLVQDEVGGLQVRCKDGEWIGIKPQCDAFVVNVGDLIQVWSNDRYKSVEHRVVVNDNKPRFSFPLFFNPSPHTNVAPLPELLLPGDEAPLYHPYNWGEFMKTKKASNFKNMGVETLQIHHFAIKLDEKGC